MRPFSVKISMVAWRSDRDSLSWDSREKEKRRGGIGWSKS